MAIFPPGNSEARWKKCCAQEFLRSLAAGTPIKYGTPKRLHSRGVLVIKVYRQAETRR